jgi:GYF domain 2
MKYYYANAANQPAGPVTLDELRQLLARGEITPATNVIPVGETAWRPLSTFLPAVPAAPIPPATPTPPPTAPAAAPSSLSSAAASPSPAFKPADVAKLPTILASFIGGLIAKARALLSIPRLTALFIASNAFGQILVLSGAALALIYGVVYAIKYNSFDIFLYGLASIFVLAVLQFVAKRLLDACASILKTSPTRVASVAVLECFGLLLLLAGLGALASGIITAIQLETLMPLLPALVAFTVLTASGGIALHPSLANVEEAPATAGEEAIGLFSFFAKSGLLLQPLLFGVYAAAGALVILLSIFGQDTAFAASLVAFAPFDISAGSGGPLGVIIIAASCLFPLVGYLSFLAYYLLIDVLRAILSIPQKLDQLRR